MKTIIKIITLTGVLLTSCKKEAVNLEIYTYKNIYYINGLTVTNEATTDTLRFKDMKSLSIYISDITAKESNEKIK